MCGFVLQSTRSNSRRNTHRRCAPSHLDLVRDRLFRSRDRFWYGLLERLLFLELERRLVLLLLRLRSDVRNVSFSIHSKSPRLPPRSERSPVAGPRGGTPPPGFGPGPGPRASFTVFAFKPWKKRNVRSSKGQSVKWRREGGGTTPALTSSFDGSRNERLRLSNSSHGFFDLFIGRVRFQAGAQVQACS